MLHRAGELHFTEAVLQQCVNKNKCTTRCGVQPCVVGKVERTAVLSTPEGPLVEVPLMAPAHQYLHPPQGV